MSGEDGSLVERALDEARESYVAGSIDVHAYERRVERILSGIVFEPSERDRAIARAVLRLKPRPPAARD